MHLPQCSTSLVVCAGIAKAIAKAAGKEVGWPLALAAAGAGPATCSCGQQRTRRPAAAPARCLGKQPTCLPPFPGANLLKSGENCALRPQGSGAEEGRGLPLPVRTLLLLLGECWKGATLPVRQGCACCWLAAAPQAPPHPASEGLPLSAALQATAGGPGGLALPAARARLLPSLRPAHACPHVPQPPGPPASAPPAAFSAPPPCSTVHFFASPDKAKRVLGWQPQHNFLKDVEQVGPVQMAPVWDGASGGGCRLVPVWQRGVRQRGVRQQEGHGSRRGALAAG